MLKKRLNFLNACLNALTCNWMVSIYRPFDIFLKGTTARTVQVWDSNLNMLPFPTICWILHP